MPPRRKKKPKATRLCSAYAAPTTVPVLQLVAKELSWKLVDVPEASAGTVSMGRTAEPAP